jgi:hypothetical protein
MQRIEPAHLGASGDERIEKGGGQQPSPNRVHQHPHLYPAPCCRQQSFQKSPSHFAVRINVRFQPDAPPGSGYRFQHAGKNVLSSANPLQFGCFWPGHNLFTQTRKPCFGVEGSHSGVLFLHRFRRLPYHCDHFFHPILDFADLRMHFLDQIVFHFGQGFNPATLFAQLRQE